MKRLDWKLDVSTQWSKQKRKIARATDDAREPHGLNVPTINHNDILHSFNRYW